MEGMVARSTYSNVQSLTLEESYNVADLMNFDTYGGWCNMSNNLVDQMFPSFANVPPLDGLDSDANGSSLMTMLSNMDYELSFPTSYVDDEFNLIEMRDNTSKKTKLMGDLGNTVIPRPLTMLLDEKMLRALNLFREWSGGGILVQVWVPMKDGDQYVLSTSEQPYLLDQTLTGYREVSRAFTFAAEQKSGSFSGLPGRVYASKIPEWTSNVMYYNKSEYLRVQHAVNHEVRGSIAIPILEGDSQERSCCAVLELVTTKEMSDFNLEMENVCRALQAVNLRSTAPPRLHSQNLSNNQRAALAEIRDVLRVVCHAHRLPLALTWIPCSYIDRSGEEAMKIHVNGHNRGAHEKNVLCIEDSTCYVNDNDMQCFVQACRDHYLEEGQGIVGKALQSNHPFFYPDIKEYHISEYPLVHHARKFGLNAAVAIRLKSTYTGDNDYILEFFLPTNMKGNTEQQLLLNNLSSTMQRICKSLRRVSDIELHEIDDHKGILPQRSSEESLNTVDLITQNVIESITTKIQDDGLHAQNVVGTRKYAQKKRSTAEKHVSLSVLQQYFSGSLKDAAKSIGVCPTTLKRICRQNGISRWPSRKINKVNRSLMKIQSVLDSVQGLGEGFNFNPKKFAVHDKVGDEIDTISKDGIVMDWGEVVEHNNSSSSSTTDSSKSGSMMNTISVDCGMKVVVKATYKDDTVRFKFGTSCGCVQLYEEIAKRFELQIGQFQLKYLDNEEEWVRLVSDSDLQECFEIMDFAGIHCVKFSVIEVASFIGSSVDSNCFLGEYISYEYDQ